MSKKYKKLSEEILHENPWYVYKHDTYQKPDGTTGDYFYVQTNGMALVVPVLPDGRIVMIRQERYLSGRPSIEFPGGGIKKGMTMNQAALLELKEETGYSVNELILVGEFEPDSGVVLDRVHVFMAEVAEQDQQQLDDTESIEVLYRYPDEIERMIRANDIWDGETMAAWSLVRHRFIT